MALIGKLAALGSAAAATTAAASLTWIALQQPPKPHRATSSRDRNGADDITVCVDSNSILRAAGPRGCASGDRRLVVERAEKKLLVCDDDCDAWGRPTSKNPPSPDSDSLAALERRVDKLRVSPMFEVVDTEGNVIFTVAPGRVRLIDDRLTAVQMSATADGGVFTARSRDESRVVTVGTSAEHAGLAIAEDDIERVDLGLQPAGNYALRIMSPTGAAVAGIGESRGGSGAAVAADTGGRTRASITVDGGGVFGVFNPGGTAIVSLRQSRAANGFLSVGDASGREVAKMVVNDNRYGVVITGPVVGFPLVTGSGLPGSYILGCARGPSCIP
jgi:hypothetical protein